jgi:ubiquinone/menaquinone biosynthesis C-methylase UbiE
MPGTPEDARQMVHLMWSAVADTWADNAELVDRRGAAIGEEMLRLAHVRAGQQVLELACGPGGLGLAAAGVVGPDGRVVVSDVVEAMVATAAKRAADLGLANVVDRVLDLEQIDEPDAAFDVVLCREGLMFAVDPAQAAAELGRPLPPPGMPGPFALEDGERLTALLRDAGLADVELVERAVPLALPSFDAWWARTVAMAGPISKILQSLAPEQTEAIQARLRATAAPYLAPDGSLDLPGVSLVVSARRPGEAEVRRRRP